MRSKRFLVFDRFKLMSHLRDPLSLTAALYRRNHKNYGIDDKITIQVFKNIPTKLDFSKIFSK